MTLMNRKTEEELKRITKLRDNFNRTTQFLLPALGISIEKWVEYGFINCFLKDCNKEKMNDKDIHLYLLFKPDEKQLPILTKRIEELENLEDKDNPYLDDYDYSNGYIVLVLKFPRLYKNDYNLFLRGKYSLFSRDYKDLFSTNKITQYISPEGKVETLSGKSFAYLVFTKDNLVKKYWERKMNTDPITKQLIEPRYRVYIPENQEFCPIWNEDKDWLNIDQIIKNA